MATYRRRWEHFRECIAGHSTVNGTLEDGRRALATGACRAAIRGGETRGEGPMNSPSLSVVLLSPDSYETIRKTVAHLRKQTIAGEIELVIVVADSNRFQPAADEFQKFHGVTIVQAPISSVGAGYAEGIRGASAPVVALAEDHSFPQPGWAEALLRAHRGNYAAVAARDCKRQSTCNRERGGYPDRVRPLAAPKPRRAEAASAGSQQQLQEGVLLQYGDRLAEMMDCESVLHWDLVRKGHQLFVEASAVTAHTNFEKWSSWLPVQYHSGRVFTARRSQIGGWSAARKVAFAAAWPFIPLVRLKRIAADLKARGQSVLQYASVIPAVIAGLYLSALGEAVGCLFGSGASIRSHGLLRIPS